LRRTRWPEPEPVDDWSQGLPLTYAQELCRSWAEDYDFGFAARLNAFPQYRATVDGLGIHFLHVRSPEPDALPLVVTHGWPGSVAEFLRVLGPLTDPRAHGGDWGSAVSGALGEVAPERVVGVHVNMAPAPQGTFDDAAPEKKAALVAWKEFGRTGRGYSAVQSTRPQTLGYGLTDSPAGQAAWIAEKFWAWTDHNGHPEDALSRRSSASRRDGRVISRG